MKRVLSVLLALVVSVAPVFANVKPSKGFDKKVYDGAFALYASSHEVGIRDRFICSAQAFKKVGDGYLLLSAGHCTPANPGLPPDMEFSVAEDLGGSLTPVVLVQSQLDRDNRVDFSEFYLRTNKSYPMMELGDESDARIGDETIDVNFSLALNKFASKGHVSSEVQKDGEMKGLFGVDQFDSHGASGSSVVDKRTKKVIGIVVAGVDGATVSTWVEPISTIKKELAKVTLPRSTKPYVSVKYPAYVPSVDDSMPKLPAGTPETAPAVGVVADQAKHYDE
ncbi:MAG TPA: serine protease [Anaerolineales bacterium]|nr:serine protease [Anaerolineales bacterium]